MPALAATAVTVLSEWYEGRAQQLVTKKLRLVLTAQGTVANPIDASVLGLRKIVRASPAVKSDNTLIFTAAPNILGTILLLRDAATGAPADVTATVDLTVTGEG